MSTPRTMSTQHPDNVALPFFTDGQMVSGEAEVTEAYYVFSHFGCSEQMWDCEGKEVDGHVVEKLLTRYPDYFARHQLGDELRLTIRVPNPDVEKNQAKILLETLESIPRHYDIAAAAANGRKGRPSAGNTPPPIFEVILPMTTSARQLLRIENYYRKVVVGKGAMKLSEDDITIREWLGETRPKDISLIPLIEDAPSLQNIGAIIGDYLAASRHERVRVFLARSDPALNYGSVAAVLLAKTALHELGRLEEKDSVEIEPIIGVGSAPFRGNLKPTNPHNCLGEYPSVQTFTIQSSFKYDHPPEMVRAAIEKISETSRKKPLPVDGAVLNPIIDKSMKAYQEEVALLAPAIERVARHVPKRRARRLHVGLFGYSRQSGGVRLPRAITFCASLYSLGVPPEMLGLSALDEKDWEALRGQYANLEEDLKNALPFCNPAVFSRLPPALPGRLKKVLDRFSFEPDAGAADASAEVWRLLERGDGAPVQEAVVKSALLRGFLG